MSWRRRTASSSSSVGIEWSRELGHAVDRIANLEQGIAGVAEPLPRVEFTRECQRVLGQCDLVGQALENRIGRLAQRQGSGDLGVVEIVGGDLIRLLRDVLGVDGSPLAAE